MAEYTTLNDHLARWAKGRGVGDAAAETVAKLAEAGRTLCGVIAQGPLAGDMAAARGTLGGGDLQKELDALTHAVVTAALKSAPVAWMGSEEDEQAIRLNGGAPIVVNIDPLDGSSNIETNVSVGTIFSLLPAQGDAPLLQPGRNQIAAGYIVYGPQTALALTLGEGTQLFTLDPKTQEFLLVEAQVAIPAEGREYAINASNARHWDAAIAAYIRDCNLGADGPRQADFNMRWVGSLVADAFRIFKRGGIYLYPADRRKGYGSGRLRLLYEANPLAMLTEQAGGAATTGSERVLDVRPTSLHQRAPLVFGSKREVEEVVRYYREAGAAPRSASG